MATKILAKLPAADGIEFDVAQIERGYSVTLHDIEADDYICAKIFKTEAQAMAYASEMIEKSQ